MIASRIRSTRPLFCESTSRKPRPADEAISSAATRNSHDWASAEAEPGDDRRQHRRELDRREQPHAAKTECAAGLHEVPVDVPEGSVHRRVDREERADRDERDLGVLADLEPQDEQRDPGQRRDRADRAERRAEAAGPTSRGSPVTAPSSEPERRADGEPDQHPLRGDRDEATEQPALGQVDGGVENTIAGDGQLDRA